MGQPGLILLIFGRFKHKFYRKTVDFSRIQTPIVGVEGVHADHLTSTTARQQYFFVPKLLKVEVFSKRS